MMPIRITTAEKNNALLGTLREVSLVIAPGALCSFASEYIIRLVLKTALLLAEAADVSTTKLMMLAAAMMPTAARLGRTDSHLG